MRVSPKVKWFFLVFGLVYFLESIGGFYMGSAVVFIERQFQIPSRISGTMVSAGDFAYIPCVLFTSYFGGKGNRAKWIGAGCVLIAIANFMISSSNFLFPRAPYDHDLANISKEFSDRVEKLTNLELNTTEKMSSDNRNNNVRVLTSVPYGFCDRELNDLRTEQVNGECEANPPSLGPFFMIFGGLLFLGVGRTMPYSLGLPLMDDNVKKSNLPVYFAIMFLAKILGPTIGLLIGGQLNKIYYNFSPPHGLNPQDPMWIGCWWMGFLIFGSLLLFPSIALYFFPEEDLEKEDEIEMQKLNPAEGEAKKKEPIQRLILVDKHKQDHGHLTATQEFKAFLGTLWDLFKLPIYIGSVLGRVVDVLASKGFFVFIGKYLQLQFDVPQHTIQQIISFIGVFGFISGVGMGSFITKKFKLDGRKAAIWVASCSLGAALLSFANGLVGCNNVVMDIGRQGQLNNFTFVSCDRRCNCEDAPLYPVCDDLGTAFYSPCHAGCPIEGKLFNLYSQEKRDLDSFVSFANCSCAGGSQTVSRSKCVREECKSNFRIFFIIQATGAFFGGLGVVPGMLIILRSVKPEHRSVSLGFSGLVVSLFATLPSPVFWGKIYDISCLHWPTFCGNRTAACQLYNMDELRVRMHVIYGSMRVFSLLSDMWVVYWAKGLKLFDDDDEKKEEDREEEVRHNGQPKVAAK